MPTALQGVLSAISDPKQVFVSRVSRSLLNFSGGTGLFEPHLHPGNYALCVLKIADVTLQGVSFHNHLLARCQARGGAMSRTDGVRPVWIL